MLNSTQLNHLSIQVEPTVLWGFWHLPSAYGNVYLFIVKMGLIQTQLDHMIKPWQYTKKPKDSFVNTFEEICSSKSSIWYIPTICWNRISSFGVISEEIAFSWFWLTLTLNFTCWCDNLFLWGHQKVSNISWSTCVWMRPILYACFYIPSESHFYTDSNATNNFLIWPELTEIWHFW